MTPAPPESTARRHSLWLSLVVAAVLLFVAVRFWPQGQARALVSGNSDAFMYHLPVRAFAFDALRSARLPTWNPYILGGQPFLATHQAAALYPGNFPHWFLPAGRALGVVMALHVLWAALGMWVWLRQWGHPPAARALGALTFAFAVVGVRTLQWPHVLLGGVWLPWVCAGIDAVAARPEARRAAWLALACTCLLLAGYIQGAVYLYYVLAPYALVRWWQTRDPQSRRRAGWLGTGLLAWPLLCAAIQLAPLVELALHSARPAGALDPAAVQSLGHVPGREILFGLLGRVSSAYAPLIVQPLALAWLVALAAVWAGPPRGRVLFWVLAGALAAVLAAGFDTPLYRVYFALPTGAVFRVPVRLLVITACAVGVLVSTGATALLRRETAASLRRPQLALTLAAGVGLAVVSGDWLFGALSLACALVWLLRPRAGAAAVVAACTLTAWHGIAMNPRSPYLPWHGPPPFPEHEEVRAFLHEQLGHDRLHVYRPDGDWRTWSYPANWGMRVGLRQLTGYESLPLQRVGLAFAHLESGRPHTSPLPFVGGLELTPAAEHPEWLHRWSVRWIVVDRGADSDARGEWLEARLDLQRVRVGTAHLLYNPHALPRAYWVPHARGVPTDGTVWTALAADSFDPRTTVLLEPPPAVATSGADAVADADVSFVRDDAAAVELRVAGSEAGWLVLTDAWYPGWQATVGGTRTPIHVANGVFRAVPVPAGEHVVRFRYRSPTVRLGAIASAVGLLLAVICLGAPTMRTRRDA